MALRALATLAAVLLVPVAGCGSGPRGTASGRNSGVSAVAAFYPLEYAVQRVGGADVDVTGLTKPGTEPHDLELSPRQVTDIQSADVIVVLGGFQPAVDDALRDAGDRVLDVATVAPLQQGYAPIEDGELHADERGADPHVWLDPRRYAAIARAIGDRLAAADPAGAAGYRSRAEELAADLDGLHQEYAAGLRGCRHRELVTSHNAFGYLARAYGLDQIGITGLTPEDEPTPARLAQVIELARTRKVTTVFFEELVSPKVARSLADEIGARAEVLSPLESAPEDGDYFTAMRANLAALRTALVCA